MEHCLVHVDTRQRSRSDYEQCQHGNRAPSPEPELLSPSVYRAYEGGEYEQCLHPGPYLQHAKRQAQFRRTLMPEGSNDINRINQECYGERKQQNYWEQDLSRLRHARFLGSLSEALQESSLTRIGCAVVRRQVFFPNG